MIPNFSEHASNERTFLSWVRSVIAIVAFGIGAGRLGSGDGPWWTEALVIGIGGAVIIVAYLRMQLLRKRIDSEDTHPDEGALAGTILLVLVVTLFFLLGAFALNFLR